MRLRAYRFLIVWLAFTGWNVSCFAQPRQFERQVVPGITMFETVDSQKPVTITALKVNIKQPGVKVGAFVGNDRIQSVGGGKDRETVSSAAARKGAVAGINGDFFPWTGDPLGFTVVDGRIVSEPYTGRPAFGITRSGQILLGVVKMGLTFEFDNGRWLKPNGVDRPLGAGELLVYEREWGMNTGAGADTAELILRMDWAQLTETGSCQAVVEKILPKGENSPIPGDGIVLVANGPRVRELLDAAEGQKSVKVGLILQDELNRSWLGVHNAVGGWPMILRDNTYMPHEADAGQKKFSQTRHPRTAVGVTKNGSLLLAVVDGRQITGGGASLRDLAQIMSDLGCTEAMNLDGGGSSTMVVRGLVINSPSDGKQRAVASGVLLYAQEPGNPAGPIFMVEPSNVKLVSGAKQAFMLKNTDGTPLTTAENDSVIWGTKNGGGLVDQTGLFTALRTGNPVVGAWYNARMAEASVTVSAGGPGSLQLTWDTATPESGDVRNVVISVKDSLGNVVAWAKVKLSVTGGTADTAEVQCGPDGIGKAIITWDKNADPAFRFIEASTNGVTATLKNQ